MVLTKEITKKINEFVYQKPRSINEIAKYININWRTANNYVEKIEKEQGTISSRVFRGGTRGSLKVVFWNNMEKFHASNIQERLFKQIIFGRYHKDFSPSEIFQFIDNDKKEMKMINKKEYSSSSHFKEFVNELRQAEKQILFLSGNLSFVNLTDQKKRIFNVLEVMGKDKISLKFLNRVELAGIDNIQNVLSINQKTGRDVVEVRHCFHPIRGNIIDNKVAILRESLDPKDYSKDEMKEKMYILYYIYDEQWVEWLQKIFWHLFRSSIDAKKRMEELKLLT
ncbi:MAG: hypothetical protein ABIE55_03965 [Candidatus Aenigmatarchaeota archaeon]